MAISSSELVEIIHKQAITTSLKVAEYFGKEHAKVVKDIDRIISDCAEMASEQETPKMASLETTEMFRKSSYKVEGQLRSYPMYYMNFDGFTLLAMGFTGKEALKFKLDYIQAFNKMRKILEQQRNAEWQAARKLTKIEFRRLTDTIRDVLIPLMEKEGASEAAKRWVYKNYVSMIQKLLGIPTGGRDEIPLALQYELSKAVDMARVIIKGRAARRWRAGGVKIAVAFWRASAGDPLKTKLKFQRRRKSMAKDGTNRGGMRIGAGRPRKSQAEKQLEGQEKNQTMAGKNQTLSTSPAKIPAPSKYLSEKQRDGTKLAAARIYRETFNWLGRYGCAGEVNRQLVEGYAQATARHVQAEQELSRSGLLTRAPDGTVVANPLTKISLEYLKAANQLFFQLRRFVEENGTPGVGGEIDTMEKILRFSAERR